MRTLMRSSHHCFCTCCPTDFASTPLRSHLPHGCFRTCPGVVLAPPRHSHHRFRACPAANAAVRYDHHRTRPCAMRTPTRNSLCYCLRTTGPMRTPCWFHACPPPPTRMFPHKASTAMPHPYATPLRLFLSIRCQCHTVLSAPMRYAFVPLPVLPQLCRR